MTLVEDKIQFKETSALLWEYKAILDSAIRYTNVQQVNTLPFNNQFLSQPLKSLIWLDEQYFGKWTLHLKGEEYQKIQAIRSMIDDLYNRMPDFDYALSLNNISEESLPAYYKKYQEVSDTLINKYNAK